MVRNLGCFVQTGLIALLGLGWVAPAAAEPIVALTVQNALIMFDSATPGTVSAPVAVTGLLAGDFLGGIDRRPSLGPNNGVLYGFGVNFTTGAGHIYTLDPLTGGATLVSTLAADPADTTAPFPYTGVSGSAFGVDFNPTVDRLRVTSDTDQNLRINVDNGLVQLDVPLAYQPKSSRCRSRVFQQLWRGHHHDFTRRGLRSDSGCAGDSQQPQRWAVAVFAGAPVRLNANLIRHLRPHRHAVFCALARRHSFLAALRGRSWRRDVGWKHRRGC